MLISVRNLTCRVGKKTLLDDLSFDVQPGEYLTIIGPNGAGKSTKPSKKKPVDATNSKKPPSTPPSAAWKMPS